MGKHRLAPEGKSKNGGFWAKLVIATIVVLWLSLVVGNWLGHFLVEKGYLGKNLNRSERKIAESRPSYSPIPLKKSGRETPEPLFSPRDFKTTVPLKTSSPTETDETETKDIEPAPGKTEEAPPPPPETDSAAKPPKPKKTPAPGEVTETVQKTPA